MRKGFLIEHCYCDVCGELAWASYACHRCGKDQCYKHAVIFQHLTMDLTGQGDVHYCPDCEVIMRAAPDELFKALLAIEALRKEKADFLLEFEPRAKQAEDYLKSLPRS